MSYNPAHGPSRRQILSLNSLNILIIDDNWTDKKLMAKMLGKQGYRAILAKDKKDACHILQNGEIDLILLDRNIPMRNGLDIVGVVQEKEKLYGRRIPIVMLAREFKKKDRDKGFSVGLDEYLPKPVFEDELYRVIEKLSGDFEKAERFISKVAI